MITLKNRIDSQEDLILNSAGMVVDFCQHFDVPYYKIGQLDMDGMKELFKTIMDAFPEFESMTKSAIKKYYHSTSFFGISDVAMSRYLCDLREYFRDYV